MVEAVVRIVMCMLSDVAIKEVLQQNGVGENIERLKDELRSIQCFLKDADSKRRTHEGVKNWINDVRRTSHMIEDAIDTFLVELHVIDRYGDCRDILCCVKSLMLYWKNAAIRHKLIDQIDHIKDHIHEMSERRRNYGIKGLDEGRVEEVRRPVRRTVLPEFDNTEVVGLEIHKDNIIKRLVDRSILRRSVISIVGTGGIGKTTLAQKTYKSMVGSFDYHIWLPVSQEFKLNELLKMMLEKLRRIKPNENDKGEEYFLREIHRSLKTKKYLVVLDDVWTKDLWIQLEPALPDANNGSRVMITTRNKDVALAESYELPFLNKKESEELLLKKAFQYRDPNVACPNDLLGLVKQFARKCGGLPLALVVVGGLLSNKEANYIEWKRVLRNINWSECTDILASSYDDLPVHLKPCFMYFGCYPEDFEILEDAIIKMWVSEGFIPQEAEGTPEDVAVSYLGELIQRCMVQVIEKEHLYLGKVRYLRIHDLLRDLAIQEAMEETNLSILSKESVRQTTKGASRRATLQNCNLGLMKHTGSNLRSLLCFNNHSQSPPNYSGFPLLKVLNFENVEFSDEAKLDWLKELIHLKYIGFLNCWKSPKLPDDIDHCKSLETLHMVGFNYDFGLPKSLWSIKSLRHAINQFRYGIDKSGPPASVELTNLLTLIGVNVDKSWVTSLPRLPNLCTLHLSNRSNKTTSNQSNKISWDVIANLLCKLNHLISLKLSGNDFTKDILDTRKFSSYENMHFLKLHGCWSKSMTLDASMFPLHLTELVLSDSYLEQDPMPELKKLTSLRVLVLEDNAYHGKKMTLSAGGFHSLNQLTIYNLEELEDLTVEENSMPVLNKLRLECCPKMQMFPDLQHVPTLRKLHLVKMRDHIKSRAQNEDCHKIEHVQLLDIRSSVNDFALLEV